MQFLTFDNLRIKFTRLSKNPQKLESSKFSGYTVLLWCNMYREEYYSMKKQWKSFSKVYTATEISAFCGA